MQISNSEKRLMDILWQDSTLEAPISAKRIIEQLGHKTDWHDKTIKTLLNRLLKKQAIGFRKKGREYQYYPILAQKDYVEVAADHFLNRVFNGSVSALVASFAKQEKLTDQDLSELKSLIHEMEKSTKGDKNND